MSQNYAKHTASQCRLNAEAWLRMAEFVQDRCETFECLCCHSGSEIHVYDQEEARRLFGSLGWAWLHCAGYSTCNEDVFGKKVDGIMVSYWQRQAPQHAFPPSLPPL